MRGTVVEFDDFVGLGVIRTEGADYPFHCTRIADGTRTIPVGATVDFVVEPHPRGRLEGAAIRLAP
jgi:cold shock CspA family protein